MDERRDLAAYVPRVAREWLDSSNPEERHRRIEGSMIFVDISGFTKLSERLARLGKIGAEGVTDVIATCFDRLLAEAYEYNGSLLKFGGDALLLFYRGDSHVHRAAAAALAMRRTLRDVSRFDTDVGRVRLGMTVGVHTGAFDFFLVGDSHRELVITGPVTSELVATEAGATTGDIVVSAACAAGLAPENIGDERASGRLLRGRITTIRGEVEFYDTALALSGFVPRALAEAIRNRRSLESEHRQVTVAFLQFAGLDQRIRAGDAADVAADLERLMAIVQRAVDARRLCFLSTDIAADGGKIILTAGAPSTTGNDEERMLLALREIVDAGPPIPLRIGVNAGPVFAGEIGTVHRRNYTVMGDPVNLAARVMAKAPVGQILATSVVLDRSHTLFDTTPLEPFNVKGKRQPVVAHSVGPARAVRQQVAASGLPLVGRETELAILDEALAGGRHNRGCSVELVAEPGAGKTRLLQAFLERTDGFEVHRVGCRLYQVDSPYQSMSQLLGAALGLTGESTADRTRQLHDLVATRCPSLLPWLSLIGVALHLDIEESDEVRQLDATFRKSRLEGSIAQLLGAVLTRPTVLCVEDAHWMDDASTGVMGALADSARSRPWIVIATRRAQGAPPPDGVRHTRIELAPLDRRSAINLIAAATAGYPLPRHVVEGMAERCDGNPLYLLELLNAVRNGGNLESMPTTVEALISARIDRLPPTERATLRRASVLGVGFLAVHVAAVLADADPTEALHPLSDFVTIDAAGWATFRHALVRDVAYEGLPFATRRQLHGRVADAIRAAESTPHDQAALLSLHLLHAHRDVEAWQCSMLAADRARSVYANLDAAALYERAIIAARRVGTIDAAERAAVYESLGDVQDLAGLYREARQSYAMSRRLLRYDVSRHASVILKEAYVAERQGRYSESIRSVRRGLKLLDQERDHDDERLRARLTTWEGAVRATQGRFRQALDSADRGIGLSNAAGDELTLARAYLIVDFAQINLGGAIGPGLAAAALEIYTRLGDLGGEANAANNLGGHYFYEGRWDEAAELYRQARRARDRMGDPVYSAFFAVNEAEILVEQGHLGQAIEALEEALTVLRAASQRSGIAFASQVLGIAKLRAGDLEAGADLIAAARDDYAALGARSAALDTSVGLAEYLVLDSRPQDAIALIDTLIEEQEAHGGHEPQMPAAHRLRGCALAQLGRADAAESELRLAVATGRQLGADHEIGLALDALDALGAAFGKISSTDDTIERDEIFGRLGIAPRRDLRSIEHVNTE